MFGWTLARRAQLQLRASVRFYTAAAPNSAAVERATHILGLSESPKPEEPPLSQQQRQFLQMLGPTPEAEQIDLAFKVYEKVLSLSASVDRFSCARLSLLCLNGGMPDRALEPWARLLETLASKTHNSKAVERILNQPEFEPAALAALTAYFVIAGPAADPETAAKLVPRQDIPHNFTVLRDLGGIKSKDAQQVARKGLAKLRRHATAQFTSPEFLKYVSEAKFAELTTLWDQVRLASEPHEIPEVCYAAFIRRFAETKQTRKSFDLWQVLVKSGVPVTIVGWTSLLRAAVLAPENAEVLFDSMWDRMLANGFKPDAACMTVRIMRFTRTKNIDNVLREFEAIRRTSPELVQIEALNMVLAQLARAQRYEEADALLAWGINDNKLEPTEYTYNALISASARNTEQSAKYLQEMIDRGIKPSVVTYTFAMQQLLKRGQPIGDLLKEMQDAKIEPNERFNATMAYYLGKNTHDLSIARKTMDALLKNQLKLKIETLGAFIELELRHGDVDRAVQYTELMHKFGLNPNIPTYNQLISGALRRKRVDIATTTFNKMASGPIIRLRPNTQTYAVLLRPWSLAELQNNEAARKLIRDTVAPHIQAHPNLIDFHTAKRIETIADATGADLISPELRETCAQRAMEQYDRKLAR